MKPPKTRYSDKELQEFKELILKKLESARKEFQYLQEQISRTGDSNAADAASKNVIFEDAADTQEREQINQMAARQRKFIDNLEKALVRIENKTYGICRETGELISKKRLKAVPHATLSIEAKKERDK